MNTSRQEYSMPPTSAHLLPRRRLRPCIFRPTRSRSPGSNCARHVAPGKGLRGGGTSVTLWRGLLAALLLLACGQAVLAWDGRLRDPEDRPVVDARVSLPGEEGAAALSDAAGRFSLPGPAPDLLLVELADGTVLAVPVPPPGAGGERLIRVDPALGETVESVARPAGHLVATPVARPWISRGEQAAERGAVSVQETIARLPGAAPPTADPDRVPSIRGLADRRTLFLLDGGVVATERRAGVSGGSIHAGTFDAVEVIRGPAAFLYGSGAMGGVVLLRSPWAEPESIREGLLRGEWRGGGVRSVDASVSWRDAGWSFAAGARRQRDPEAPGGVELDGAYRQQSLFGGRGWSRGEDRWHAGIRFDRLEDAERLSFADSGGPVVPEDSRLRLILQWDRGGEVEHSVASWCSVSRRRLSRPDGAPKLPPPTTTSKLWGAGARWMARGGAGAGSWTVGGEARLAAGIETRLNRLPEDLTQTGATIGLAPLDGASQASLGIFGGLHRRLGDRVSVDLGGRIEPTRTRATTSRGAQQSSVLAWAAGAGLSGKAGRLGGWAVHVARTFREPTASDRFEESLTGRGLKLPSADLAAEKGLQFDASWRVVRPRGEWSLAVFRYALDDVIVRRFLDTPPEETPVYFFANGSGATIRGIEASAVWRLGERLSLQASAHRLRGQETGDGPLADIPADGLRLELRHRGPRGFGRAEVFAARRDARPGSGEQATGGYAVVNFSAGRQLGPSWRLVLRLDNALDHSYASSARRGDPPSPGRTVGLALERSF